MAKSNKTTLIDVIKHFISIIFGRIKSIEGIVNICFGFIILLVAFLVLAEPIANTVLQIFQSIINMILILCDKQTTIPIAESGNVLITLLICLIILLLESIFCSLIVNWAENKKRELNNT